MFEFISKKKSLRWIPDEILGLVALNGHRKSHSGSITNLSKPDGGRHEKGTSEVLTSWELGCDNSLAVYVNFCRTEPSI